jgi:hypothetical protein
MSSSVSGNSEKKNETSSSPVHSHLESPVRVIHHVDYRAKAEERKVELEVLRRQSLAKPKGRYIYIFELYLLLLCSPHFCSHTFSIY